MRSIASGLAAGCAIALLAGCAVQRPPVAAAPDITVSPWARESAPGRRVAQAERWEHYRLPGKTPVAFSYADKDGRQAVSAVAAASASMLRHRVRIEPAELGSLRFSWKVPQLMAEADMARRDTDDSPVRVILAFDGDRSRFSAKDSLLAELTRSLTGEEMPYATLMYVWCNKRSPGTVIPNPRTDRVRKLVLESGPGQLGRWLDYERDIRADFRSAFGEDPGALVGVAIMTDSDNTRSTTQAWYGPVRLVPPR